MVANYEIHSLLDHDCILLHAFVEVCNASHTKVTTPNFEHILKLTTTNSCLKCTPPTIHKSLKSVLEISISSTSKIRILFIWCPKNAF